MDRTCKGKGKGSGSYLEMIQLDENHNVSSCRPYMNNLSTMPISLGGNTMGLATRWKQSKLLQNMAALFFKWRWAQDKADRKKWIGYTRNHPLPPTAQQREDTRCGRTRHIPDPLLPNPLGYQLSELRGKKEGRSARGNYFIRFCKSLLTLKILNQTQRTHPCAKTFRPPAPRTPPSLRSVQDFDESHEAV